MHSLTHIIPRSNFEVYFGALNRFLVAMNKYILQTFPKKLCFKLFMKNCRQFELTLAVGGHR